MDLQQQYFQMVEDARLVNVSFQFLLLRPALDLYLFTSSLYSLFNVSRPLFLMIVPILILRR